MSKGIRVFAACVLFVPSAFALLVLSTVPKFEQIFADMMGGAQLPAVSLVLFKAYPVIMLIVVGIFGLALGFLVRSRSDDAALCFAGAAFVIMTVINALCWAGCYLPFLTIVSSMSDA